MYKRHKSKILIAIILLGISLSFRYTEIGQKAWADISSLANRNLERLGFTASGNLKVAISETQLYNDPVLGACKTVGVNRKGVAGASIVVSTSAVTIADADTTRCRLYIRNNSANGVRCASTGLTPTTTVGYLFTNNAQIPLDLGLEAQQAWQCIRTGGADATLDVLEALP